MSNSVSIKRSIFVVFQLSNKPKLFLHVFIFFFGLVWQNKVPIKIGFSIALVLFESYRVHCLYFSCFFLNKYFFCLKPIGLTIWSDLLSNSSRFFISYFIFFILVKVKFIYQKTFFYIKCRHFQMKLLLILLHFFFATLETKRNYLLLFQTKIGEHLPYTSPSSFSSS